MIQSGDTPSSTCLCCGYSLAGLPEAHKCPECGFDHELDAFAVEARPATSLFQSIVSLIAWGVMGAMIVHQAKSIVIATFILGVFSSVAIWQLTTGRHAKRFVVDRRGIHLLSGWSAKKSIAWPDVVAFKYSRVDGGLLVLTANGGSTRLCHNSKVAKGCRTAIESAWQEYRSVD